jgi:hypothetical protein
MGRSKRAENCINRTLSLDEELWEAIDTEKWKQSRNAFINDAIREKLGRQPSAISEAEKKIMQIKRIINQ